MTSVKACEALIPHSNDRLIFVDSVHLFYRQVLLNQRVAFC